jgi:ADP-ribosylation factor-binding protein GGA
LKINIAPRPKNPVFDDENKSKELARLLKSKNPQDLELANKLIKNMVKQDEMKFEKQCNRMSELEQIKNNIKLLNEMLLNFHQGLASESEKETIRYLFEELDKQRPNLIKLATETVEDNDDSIGEILQVNDQCERIINQYKFIILKETHHSTNGAGKSHFEDVNLVNLNLNPSPNDFSSANNSNLLNNSFDILTNLQTKSTNPNFDPLKELQDLFSTNAATSKPNNDFSEFSSAFSNNLLNNNTSNPTSNIENLLSSISITSQTQSNKQILTATNSNSSTNTTNQSLNKPIVPSKPFDDLNQLGLNLFEKGGSNVSLTQTSQLTSSLSLNELQQKKQTTPAATVTQNGNESMNNFVASYLNTEPSSVSALTSLNVQLESIKPGSVEPLALYDKNNLKVLLYFGRDQPSPNVHVLVVTVTSSNTEYQLKNFSFQAAVPKVSDLNLTLCFL